MPIPKDIDQSRIVVNGRPATELGRTPKIVKPWRQGGESLIDPVTLKLRNDVKPTKPKRRKPKKARGPK